MYGDRGFSSRGGGGYNNDRPLTPPVKEGDEVDVTIEAVGEKGDGIAKQKGFVLFVPGTKAGERVRIRITRVLAKVGFAQVLGPAQGPPQEQQQRSARKEPEFEPKEELDTEDFGDESGGESMGDEPEEEEEQ